MLSKNEPSKRFLIHILNDQNATWQGTVTWTDSRLTEPFRSELELIRLIDSALTTAKAEHTD